MNISEYERTLMNINESNSMSIVEISILEWVWRWDAYDYTTFCMYTELSESITMDHPSCCRPTSNPAKNPGIEQPRNIPEKIRKCFQAVQSRSLTLFNEALGFVKYFMAHIVSTRQHGSVVGRIW
jgi:hypothetical protein